MILNVLNGKNRSSARDIVLLNAGAALYVSGIASSIQQGITFAEKAIDSGKVLAKLDELRRVS